MVVFFEERPPPDRRRAMDATSEGRVERDDEKPRLGPPIRIRSWLRSESTGPTVSRVEVRLLANPEEVDRTETGDAPV
jgi:hypothetical protein